LRREKIDRKDKRGENIGRKTVSKRGKQKTWKCERAVGVWEKKRQRGG